MLISFYVCLLVFTLISCIWLCFRTRRSTPSFTRHAVIRSASAMAAAPKNQRKPEWVRAELIRLAALCGGSRCNVARMFNRLHGARYGVTVGHSFTCELLKANALQVLRLRRALKSKSPVAVPICDTWAMDLTFFTGDDKVTRASMGIVDHGSRVLLCLRTLTIRNSWTLLGYLCLAIGRYGKPRKLRTDNEIIFNSFVFKTFLRLVEIAKQTTDVHSPWQNGRMERVFGTLKPVLRALHLNGQVQLQAALDEFRLFYNHARGHLNLGNRTPAQVWQSQANATKKRRGAKRVNREPVLVQAFDGLLTGVYVPPDD